MTDKGYCTDWRICHSPHGELFEWQSKKTKHWYSFCKKCHDKYTKEMMK